MSDAQSSKLSRRKLLKGGAITAGVGAASLAMPQVSRAQTTTLRMQSSWSSSDVFHEMAADFVSRVERMAGGRLTIDLTPAGAIVGAFQVQDACSDGVIDIAHTVAAYWYGKNKAASLFGTGPVFGGDPVQMLAWVHHGGGQELYDELVQDILGLNVIGMFGMPMPPQPLGWFKQPVESAEALNGLKYRTVGLAADLFQSMGAAVTQLPGGEIVPAMERGVLDAFEFNNPTSDRRFGAQDVADYYMLGSYHQANETFEFIFNRDMFEDLPDELQAILQYGVEASSTANYSKAMDLYSADLQGLINEDGVNVLRTPESIMQAQLDAWDVLLEDLTQDEFFGRVVESQREWCERVVFYSLMNGADYKRAYQHYYPGKIEF